jgi:dephospho-CoA kinase
MLILGITGKSGAGKSTVAHLLKRRRFRVIDVDALAHALYSPGTIAHRLIRRTFGPQIINSSGDIDRHLLGKIVFSDLYKKAELDRILFPRLKQSLKKEIAKEAAKGTQKLAIDMAVLFQARADCLMDAVVLIEAPLAIRVTRLMNGRGMTLSRARSMAKALVITPKQRLKAAWVLKNHGSADALAGSLDLFLQSF